MTTPLPNGPGDPVPRSPADREKARVKVARKWAYLISTTAYVPLKHTDIEAPLLEMVHDLFTALAAEPLGLEEAERVGARLVALNCVDKSSLQCTVDVLAGPLLSDEDVRHLPPERVVRLIGAVSAGFTEAVRRRTTDQQEAMCRALMEVATKAMRAAEKRQTDFGDTSTELTLLRRQLSHQLLHDALTGLPNRQFFGTRLEEVLGSGGPTTLYRVELNGFSVFNEGLGSPNTDTLMTAIAVRLRNALSGEGLMVARFDRAGFMVLQEHGEGSARPADVVATIMAAITETTRVAGVGLATTASVGVVQSPPHRADPVEFMQAADIALRHAKEEGPGRWRLLTPDEDAHDRRLLRFAATLPGALESGQLAVGYRLRVALADRQPVAVDAFPRWQEAGLSEQRCVELVEATGLSPKLGQWVLRDACDRLAGAALPLSVHLSGNQSAAPDLVDSVLGVLDESAMPADRLRVAMPAQEVFDGRARSMDNLSSLAAAGVGMAVHDFSGAASDVVRLAGLPLRAVALTARLVSQARGAPKKSLVAKALTGLATMVHEAGAEVAVDDIRSKQEADWWRGVGADTATGPLFPDPDPKALFPD
ncbi:EAL domain-containing protein [Actinophytocola sp. NPDC049390]|uniref:EAL domain-containing protein n=1 Tax=Actinophytocola sp. NPDC049390 TaxID=3363894 RepID=UPI0037A93FC4